MRERTVMIFPQFCNGEVINEIRQKFDPLYNLVKPHITLVFPFKSAMSDAELSQRLEKCLKETTCFPLRLQGISRQEDCYGNYIFLNVDRGYQEIVKMHNALYSDIFGKCPNQPYIPHMTIGNLDSVEKMESAYNCIKKIDICLETIVDKVSVELIGNNGESIIVIEQSLI